MIPGINFLFSVRSLYSVYIIARELANQLVGKPIAVTYSLINSAAREGREHFYEYASCEGVSYVHIKCRSKAQDTSYVSTHRPSERYIAAFIF